jgi:predicted Rossmann fold nucleotide-binding protein DprA/Smf involved in DNA uptake
MKRQGRLQKPRQQKRREREMKEQQHELSHLELSRRKGGRMRRMPSEEKLDLKKEEERKKLPLITLAEEGIPTEMAYTGAKSTIKHIVSTNFARGVEWGTLSKAEYKRMIN